MSRIIATLRAVYDAPDPATALLIAEQIRENGSADLDLTDGDSLDVVQVTDMNINVTPEETITELYKARNILISLRSTASFECAREVDKIAHAYRLHLDPDVALGVYDYSEFLEVADAILKRGESPDA